MYRVQHRRVGAVIWTAIMCFSVGCGLAAGYIWSFAAGIPLMIALALVGLSAQRRISKARWIRRFPELADEQARWRRTPG